MKSKVVNPWQMASLIAEESEPQSMLTRKRATTMISQRIAPDTSPTFRMVILNRTNNTSRIERKISKLSKLIPLNTHLAVETVMLLVLHLQIVADTLTARCRQLTAIRSTEPLDLSHHHVEPNQSLLGASALHPRTSSQRSRWSLPSKFAAFLSQYTINTSRSMADTRTKNLSNISSGGGRTGVKRPHQHSFDPPRHCKSTRTNGSNTGTSRGPTTNSHGNGGHGPLWSQAVDHTSRLREPVRTSRNNPLVHSVWSGAQLVENPPLDSPPRAGIPPVVEVRQSTVVAPARLPQASTATETSRPAVTTPSTRPAELSAVIETRQTTVAAPSIPAVVQTPQHIPRVPVSAVQTHTTNDTHERSAPAPAEPNGGRPNDAVARNPVSAPRTPADLCTDDYLRSHPSLAHLFNTDAPTNASSPRQNATPFSSAQVESLLEAVDEREMGNLSTNFAAMSLTSRPAASPAPEAGIMASTHAIEPSPSQSTVSLGATTTTTNPAYLEAISSEDAFWRWKQSQTPNRPNRTGP